ncbi:NAD(P)H-binding protein [Luteipulveratus sp. YIM 133132]|uniref:NAD(P)-dependent oxidoreductase n=1 Tax=Luteipulveratus flavus TaxID=3031728 RepID=UPI0023B08E81|nr:NAD(P)H-binding protein [Luteipulveratus sp. YIM 133132]MDE9365401.1 NAD(P)H-binding protein [Luteipulveratus sp. YIM 133132]
MTRITVLGGTGYAGGHVVREAASRGHQVTSYSRNEPQEKVDGVSYRTVDVLQPQALEEVFADTEVVLDTLSPRGDLEGKLEDVVRSLIEVARRTGVRLGVLGGAGSLYVAEGGPRLIDTPEFPEQAKGEARTGLTALQDLEASPPEVDWFLVSPAAEFGAWDPGEATGKYRVGGDVLLVDENGRSYVSGADLAAAIADEIETPRYRRKRLGVAY